MSDDTSEHNRNQGQLLFTIEQVSLIFGGMPVSTIRNHVKAGRLRRCVHLGDRPWYFTIRQIEDFVNGEFREASEQSEFNQ